MTRPAPQRLNQAQRDEMTRRVLAGESAASIGKEFGVTRAYVALLKAQAVDPERFVRKAQARYCQKLTPEELQTFDEVLSATTPEDHDFIPTSTHWSYEFGQQLARKLFSNKRPSVRVIKECLAPHIPQRQEFRLTKPQPPKPHHINQLDPEMAKNADFVAYYLSPLAEKIEWREYEFALADWNARVAAAEETRGQVDGSAPVVPAEGGVAPGQRMGKHAQSKGSPFTSPKRRKR